MTKRALISVSDKTGITEFAKTLIKNGFEIISTGGTSALLKKEGIDVKDVSDITGFPEMMDGRVKTLHPKVHGGLLYLRENPGHVKQAEENGITAIDIVAVNLYPFRETVANPNVTLEDAIENIDIGGPTLLRSAAKNFASVTVICNPADYAAVADELNETGDISYDLKKKLAVKAFRHTADYDSAVDTFLSKALLDEKVKRLSFVGGEKLRYGENWHQEATFYKDLNGSGPNISNAKQLHGKELSYNNYIDMDNALLTLKDLNSENPAVVIVKHNNPCGLATGKTLKEAFLAAWDGDPISAYGSIVCVNRAFDVETAKLLDKKFIEIIVAPSFELEALEMLKKKSETLRIMELKNFDQPFDSEYVYKHVTGGLLEQTRDVGLFEKWEVVTNAPFPDSKKGLSEFAMSACKCIKSNSISIAYEYESGCYMLLGMGAGQPNRVDSIGKLAAPKARNNLKEMYDRNEELQKAMTYEEYVKQVFSECVMASDAFFPFDDSVVYANEFGLRYILSPGGSIRDAEVIETANRLGVSLVFTGMRHFLH
ncbi:Bifunctional purine biosynthesis protein PurH [Methanimicrococcus sp. At1]|uniref:Bifunctional purine biosynthesis protein PurH n=1 Tax=Methanimicrococcus hacksteinii TaxID=3028293 RepID=A0ABU3VR89_9EURY|nr:bifunctional phosphoribosylaminoimidazolecarboxamide formyltransferase/IMP cyclohydrolase [Methanimicrococcus sp. At1]MDV0445835.1 Bifunctional purine biosynthesis protein PurH [Methanimicrococcus sp. At1]